jgi:hypothetical protein
MERGVSIIEVTVIDMNDAQVVHDRTDSPVADTQGLVRNMLERSAVRCAHGWSQGLTKRNPTARCGGRYG